MSLISPKTEVEIIVYQNFFACWWMVPFKLFRIWILEAQKHGTLHVEQQSVPVVWLLLESEGAAVVEVGGKLAWRSLAQDIDGRGHFLLRDPLILLLLGGGPQSLPGEGALKQIFRLGFFWFIFHDQELESFQFPWFASTKDLISKTSN
jgi:hypothetical protein